MKKSTMLVLTLIAFVKPPDAGLAQGNKKEANLRVDASAALINALVQRTVDRTEPVDEIIQDTPVEGMGRTIGVVSAELIPDRSRAVLDIAFRGNVFSQSVSLRPHSLLYTRTTTTFDARRRIVVDGTGIHLFNGPSCARACNELLCIKSKTDCPENLTIRLAERMYHQSVAAAEAETADKTVQKLSYRMGDELTPTLADASAALARHFRAMKKAGLTVESLEFETTASSVQGRARIVGSGKSDPKPTAPMHADDDLDIRVHESLANAVAQVELGGRSFKLDEVSRIYEEVTRGLLLDGRKESDKKIGIKKVEALLAGIAGKPVTITFAEKDPLLISFADQGFTLELRFDSIRQENVTYAGERLKVAYRLENLPDGAHAVRKGRVQILPLEDPDKKAKPLPPEFRLLQDVLFDEVLTERLTLAPLPMPGAIGALLSPPRAGMADGWWALAWKLK